MIDIESFKHFFQYIFFPLSFIIIGLYFFLFPEDPSGLTVLIIYDSCLMGYLFLKSLRIKEINLFIIFALSYLIPLFYYQFGHKIITSYSHSNQFIFVNKYAFLYGLFFTIILVLFPGKAQDVNADKSKIAKKENFVVFFINIIICLFIAFFSKSGDNLLASGGYGQSEINSLGGFAIGEYFLIFFLIAFVYSGRSKFNRIILISVAVIYILESLAFGLRNEFIQLCILLFILYYKDTGKSLVYFLFILGGLYFSSLFAVFRSDPVTFLNRSILENLSLDNIVNNQSDYYISAQGDVVHSSSRLINFRDNDIVDSKTIYSSSFWFLSSSIMPHKYLPPEANIASYKQEDYPIGGGGNIFAYFYFWFWYPGVILIGIAIGLLIRFYKRYVNSLSGPYFILVFTTFPRWFAYSPINLIKMCLYGMIIYVLFVGLDIFLRKSSGKRPILLNE